MELESMVEEILKFNNGIISIYLGGSRAGGFELSNSDYDFFLLVTDDYDYEKEIKFFGSFEETHKYSENPLSSKFNCDIRARGISLSELQGQGQMGNLTKYIPVQVLLLSFPYWKHMWGKTHTLSEFKITLCGLNQQYEYALQKVKKLKERVKSGNTTLSYFVKSVLLLAGIEEQLRGLDFTPNYIEITKRFAKEPNHIIHTCLAIRNGKHVNKNKFLQSLDEYLIYLNNLWKLL